MKTTFQRCSIRSLRPGARRAGRRDCAGVARWPWPWPWLWLAMLVGVSGFRPALADDLPARPEHEIKALYIYNFTKYVTWPPVQPGRPAGAFTIGVLAPAEISEDLNRITKDKRREGAAFVIRPIAGPQDAAGCQIVVLMTTDRQTVSNLLAASSSSAILTVGEGEDFVVMGGMISFVRRKANVKLQIAPERARRAGLELNSKLLQVAELAPPDSPARE